jgi:WhiB family redox-sensing transcriptional regulator
MVPSASPFDGSQLCAQVDKDWFFPDEVDDEVEVFSLKELNAKAVCLMCPLSKACLDYALKTPSLEGIWGGTTKHERKLMRRRLRARELKLARS